MRTSLLILLAALLCLFAAGCGGGGGGDDDNPIDPSTSLIGTWQPIYATRNGSQVRVDQVLPDADEPVNRWQLVFRQTGTCTFTAYNSDGTVIETFNGTWSSDNGIAPVDIAGSNIDMHWNDNGNVMNVEYTLEGDAVVSKWVRTDPLPSEHAVLVGIWEAASIQINGSAASLSNWFDWTDGGRETLDLVNNGTAVFRELDGTDVVSTENETWAVGSGVLRITYDETVFWGYYDVPFASMTLLDPRSGNTVRLAWTGVP